MATANLVEPCPPFLGVERSLTGRRWREAACDARLATALSQRLDLPELVGRLLAARGVTLDLAEDYLEPRLRTALPDPFHLHDMEAAATRLADAVRKGETIGLFGDYDVDGATGTALLRRYFRALGAPTELHIPDRLTEGYGPNAPALLALKARGARVVVTVDCGTMAFAPLAAGTEAGLDIIVCDHHIAEPELPLVFALVNPNRLDETSPHRHLSAVGLAFLLVVAVNRVLRQAGWFTPARPEPNPMVWLDLVALGTVCDVVSLTGVNRALVAQGLKVMAQRGNAGLVALADLAGLTEPPDAWHLGYQFGPRVNAGGRVGRSDLGSRLLATDDAEEAATLARQLDQYNRERQQIEAEMLRAAIEQAETAPADGAPLVLVAGDDWHPGVVGIIAGRLRERYNLPALAVAVRGGEGMGSARSVPGFDIGAAIIAAHQAGLLLKGGGHAMAAGFTVEAAGLPALRAFLAERMQSKVSQAAPILDLDGAVAAEGATLDLAAALRRLGPFGAGNPEPRVALVGTRTVAPRVVGSGHVSCQLVGQSGARLRAIAFRSVDNELGQALLANDGGAKHIAGTLRLDHWQGETRVQFHIEDAAPAR